MTMKTQAVATARIAIKEEATGVVAAAAVSAEAAGAAAADFGAIISHHCIPKN
jgi:microcompartment protein CcmL/EutN